VPSQAKGALTIQRMAERKADLSFGCKRYPAQTCRLLRPFTSRRRILHPPTPALSGEAVLQPFEHGLAAITSWTFAPGPVSRTPNLSGLNPAAFWHLSRLQTGVLPFFTTYFGPRTACRGFDGVICRTTGNHTASAPQRAFAFWSVWTLEVSIQAAHGTVATVVVRGRELCTNQKLPASPRVASRVFRLRIVEVKKSTYVSVTSGRQTR